VTKQVFLKAYHGKSKIYEKIPYLGPANAEGIGIILFHTNRGNAS
jgi:hypothetical protein